MLLLVYVMWNWSVFPESSVRKLIGTQARAGTLCFFSRQRQYKRSFIVVFVGVMKARPDDSSGQGRDYWDCSVFYCTPPDLMLLLFVQWWIDSKQVSSSRRRKELAAQIFPLYSWFIGGPWLKRVWRIMIVYLLRDTNFESPPFLAPPVDTVGGCVLLSFGFALSKCL